MRKLAKKAPRHQHCEFERKTLGAPPDSAENYFPESRDFLPSHPRRLGLDSSPGIGADSFGSGAGSFASTGFSFFVLAPFSSVAFCSATCAASTHSIKAMGAESLLRCPSLTMRVYPPLRSVDLGAIWSNNFFTAVFCRNVARAFRRAWIDPFFPSVTIFSASGLTAFALARVVLMRWCSIKAQT
jgi:hypothetical protein